ncbi:MAG: hypothetical protein PUA93_05855 [Eubacteriales bacterium]|nr:hypothetical protein [Eubacteriales bacterium]
MVIAIVFLSIYLAMAIGFIVLGVLFHNQEIDQKEKEKDQEISKKDKEIKSLRQDYDTKVESLKQGNKEKVDSLIQAQTKQVKILADEIDKFRNEKVIYNTYNFSLENKEKAEQVTDMNGKTSPSEEAILSCAEVHRFEPLDNRYFSRLNPIDDKELAQKLSGLAPVLASMSGAAASVASTASVQGAYRVILDTPGILTKSREFAGAFRPFVQNGAGQITEMANLVPLQGGAIVASSALNVVSAIFTAVSYFFEKRELHAIQKKLDLMDTEIKDIKILLEANLTGEIEALYHMVWELTVNGQQYLTDPTNISNTKDTLSLLEERCLTRLSMTKGVLAAHLEKTYVKQNKETTNVFHDNNIEILTYENYLETLLAIYAQITKLKYLFQKGNLTLEQCALTYNQYVKEAQDLLNKRQIYIEENARRLNINIATGVQTHEHLLWTSEKELPPEKTQAIKACLDRGLEYKPIHGEGFYEKKTVFLVNGDKCYLENESSKNKKN